MPLIANGLLRRLHMCIEAGVSGNKFSLTERAQDRKEKRLLSLSVCVPQNVY